MGYKRARKFKDQHTCRGRSIVSDLFATIHRVLSVFSMIVTATHSVRYGLTKFTFLRHACYFSCGATFATDGSSKVSVESALPILNGFFHVHVHLFAAHHKIVRGRSAMTSTDTTITSSFSEVRP